MTTLKTIRAAPAIHAQLGIALILSGISVVSGIRCKCILYNLGYADFALGEQLAGAIPCALTFRTNRRDRHCVDKDAPVTFKLTNQPQWAQSSRAYPR